MSENFDEPEEFGREDHEREMWGFRFEELPSDVEQELSNFEANPYARDE